MLPLDEIKGVIFDLDGTLCESQLDFKAMRDDIGCPHDQDILTYVDNLPSQSLKHTANQIILKHELEDAHSAAMLDIGITMLSQVAQANLPTAIVTRNCREATNIKIRNNRIDISLVLTREDAPAKPDPTALLMISNEWQLHPQHLLYVGDFIYDQQAAENAGMRFWMV